MLMEKDYRNYELMSTLVARNNIFIRVWITGSYGLDDLVGICVFRVCVYAHRNTVN